MNKLTKLSIRKFRNVAPTTLEFRPGINVLLGKNAAGKTTLLRLLSTLVGYQDEGLGDDVLDVSYHASGESLDYEHTIKRTRVDEQPPLSIGPGQMIGEKLPGFQRIDSFVLKMTGMSVVRAEVSPSEVMLEADGVKSRMESRPDVRPIGALISALWKAKRGATFEELVNAIAGAHIESAGRMDESLDQFKMLLELEVAGHTSKHQSSWSIPAALPSLQFDRTIPEGTSATYSLPFLNRVAHVLGYDSASVRFDVERLRPEPDRQIVRLSNPRFFFKRPGEEISHDLLSYGQKRLLSFFAHADASRDLVIADELVNGLHHEWISACLDEIGERQAFLTSQNPLLLDFLRFDSADEVRRAFILCERSSPEAGAPLVWRNPTEEEAESFFLAYQTGIQRVSDILLTKGLW
jgi:energy-coupling factor transporter ATP-binding protein EcfA2